MSNAEVAIMKNIDSKARPKAEVTRSEKCTAFWSLGEQWKLGKQGH